MKVLYIVLLKTISEEIRVADLTTVFPGLLRAGHIFPPQLKVTREAFKIKILKTQIKI